MGDDGGDERVRGGGCRLSQGAYIGCKKDASEQVGRVDVRPSPRALAKSDNAHDWWPLNTLTSSVVRELPHPP